MPKPTCRIGAVSNRAYRGSSAETRLQTALTEAVQLRRGFKLRLPRQCRCHFVNYTMLLSQKILQLPKSKGMGLRSCGNAVRCRLAASRFSEDSNPSLSTKPRSRAESLVIVAFHRGAVVRIVTSLRSRKQVCVRSLASYALRRGCGQHALYYPRHVLRVALTCSGFN